MGIRDGMDGMDGMDGPWERGQGPDGFVVHIVHIVHIVHSSCFLRKTPNLCSGKVSSRERGDFSPGECTLAAMEFDGFFGRTALVVDAVGELTGALRPWLEARGFDLCVMTTAIEALQIAVAAHFEVVICDLQGFSLSRPAFETALERAQPALAKRCLFVAPSGAERDSRQALLYYRPLDISEILRAAMFLAATPLAQDDTVVTK